MPIDHTQPARNGLLEAAHLAGHGHDLKRHDFYRAPGVFWCQCGERMTAAHHRTAALDYLGVPASWRPFVLILLETIPLMSLADVFELAEAAAALPPEKPNPQ